MTHFDVVNEQTGRFFHILQNKKKKLLLIFLSFFFNVLGVFPPQDSKPQLDTPRDPRHLRESIKPSFDDKLNAGAYSLRAEERLITTQNNY